MSIQLTQGSALEYENILYGNMTPKMAADYLRQEKISVRSFSDTLKQMYPGSDLARRLRRFYEEIFAGENRNSINKKILYWVNGRHNPTNREDYFCIAFALGLSEAQLNFLLGLCTDYAIQYRDGREVVMAWFLRNGYSYREAQEFLATLPDVQQNIGKDPYFEGQAGSQAQEGGIVQEDSEAQESKVTPSQYYFLNGSRYFTLPNREQCGSSGKDEILVLWKKHILPFGKGYTEVSRITHEIRNDFQQVRDKEELRSCYMANLSRLGHMHLRSYYYFLQYIRQLIQPFPLSGESENDYSIETVMNTYLTLHMPSCRKMSTYSVVQRLIKHNWPNITSIRNILNRTEDVPRKILLLLYVVTENIGIRNDYNELDEEYISLEERVEDHWWTLNALLTECGMATLDLRNVFDWLILYAVSSDKEESMSSRLEGVIHELYNDVDENSCAGTT